MYLRKGLACDILLGPFVDSTNGVDPETSLTFTVKLSKGSATGGVALAARNSATAITHNVDGYYIVRLDAVDTNTLGTLVVTASDPSNALLVRRDYVVLETHIYDWFIAGTGVLEVTVAP